MTDKNVSILLVNDFASERRIMNKMLEQLGYDNVIQADDGQTALETLMQEPIELIISDLSMPGTTGLELLRMVRSHSATKEVAFLMTLSEHERHTVSELVLSGVSNYIIKPFDATTLGDKIDKII